MSDLARQLNGLVLQLRQPSRSAEDSRKKLGGVAYYLPLIKNRQNLWLVLQELALSPNLFEITGSVADIPLALYAVDGFSYACDRKHQISAPTLLPGEWESELIKIAYNLPPLLGLILLAGLVNANANAVSHLLRFMNTVCKDPSLRPSVTACLMRAQWSSKFTDVHFRQLPYSAELLHIITSQVLYTPQNLLLDTPPITKELSGWSKTMAGLLLSQAPDTLFKVLEVIQLFVRTVVAQVEDPEVLKHLFFGVLIQLEGVCNQVLANAHIKPYERVSLAIGMLEILQPLGFVIEHLGSQFEGLQFVFNACSDTLGSSVASARAVAVLGERWRFGQDVTSVVTAGDLVFFLNFSEQQIAVLTPADTEQLVLPIVLRFLDIPTTVSVFESAHCVMLSYLAAHPNFRFSKSDIAVRYFKQVMQLFPVRLGAEQFRTAVSAVINAVGEVTVNHILEELFRAAKMALPGYPLPKRPVSASMTPLASSDAAGSESQRDPPTLRAALVSALLHSAAENCDAADLNRWLHCISPMVPEPFNALAQQEREYLIQDFSDTVTSLRSETSDVGIKWYFKQGWNSKM